MTKDKDFKRLVRARMEKTGESYTAARAHLLAKSPQPLADDYESLAGMKDDAVRKSTGRSWPEWAALLDRVGAAGWKHAEIARWLRETHDVPGWWSQMVTVGYERLRGLRDKGQRRGGGYDVNKSKTVRVPLSELWGAFADEVARARWLGDEKLTIRTANEPKSMRVRLAGDAPLDVYFEAKGDAKATVTLQLRELPDRESADRARALWGERLEALAEWITSD